MSLSESRHITFRMGGEAYLVPAHSHIERLKDTTKVKFIFKAGSLPTGMEYVIADNENGYVRMVTSKGIEFNAGPLFDQLYVWFDYIIKH